MRFLTTDLPGTYVVEQERRADERGFFARFWSAEEFAAHGLDPTVAQSSISFNARRGTLRGLHYQVPPFAESKLVRCTRGAIFDVAVDLRPSSPSFCRWIGVELTADRGNSLYVPRGFAHGFLTLVDDTEVEYQISAPYVPDAARGVRWDDPRFSVHWPGTVTVIATRDREYPDADMNVLRELDGL